MNSFFSKLSGLIPANVDWMETVKLFGLFFGCALILGCLIRMIAGKRSGLNHAMSSAMGILFVYAVTIVIYAFNPVGMAKFLTPLPFVTIAGDTLRIAGFIERPFTAICWDLLGMLILALLVNLLDSYIPKGKKVIGWYLYRFVTVIMAMVLHYVIYWLPTSFVPEVLNRFAPMILVGILALLLLVGAVKIVLGVILVAVNPIIGAIYTFFFANTFGKQISKAVFTTVILCGLVFLLEYFGATAIGIAASMLVAYIPLILILLLLWYLIGHIL